MRRCERCGRYIYYDYCPYCELTPDKNAGRRTPVPAGSTAFWIVLIIVGVIAFVINPPSVIPVAGMAGIIWALTRFGGQKRKNRNGPGSRFTGK